MKKSLVTFLCFTLYSFGSQSHLFFSPEMISSHIKEYSTHEKEAILKDLDVVRSVTTPEKNCPSQRPLYIATAGAPGARKSTILERFLNTYVLNSHVAYLDPDQRALKFMAHTYQSQSLSAEKIAEHKSYLIPIKEAYEKWRGGSNFITLTLLEESFAKRHSVAHGTTSTGSHLSSFFSKLKEADYEIIMLLCSAEESFRKNAIEYRNIEQRFYQNTPEDAVSKGKVFSSKMEDYFTYADSLYIFWSDEFFEKERLGAVFSKGVFKVVDQEALECFIAQFEKDRKALLDKGIKTPSWRKLERIYQEKFVNSTFTKN